MSERTEEDILRPEHPRPDWYREDWRNLNGTWRFAFDPGYQGEHNRWYRPENDFAFEQRIQVPFPWESALSGLARKDYLGAGWYRRALTVPADWAGQRIWLNFGAVDWHARVWLNGRPIGEHHGGYTPFALELTSHVRPGETAELVVRAYDVADATTLLGKQVPRWYNHSSGIWQTVWLEATGAAKLVSARITPDVPGKRAVVAISVDAAAAGRYRLRRTSPNGSFALAEHYLELPVGRSELNQEIPIENPTLWSPEHPHLYDLTLELLDERGAAVDRVETYVGMRSISTGRWDGREYEYVLLNGEPIYLRGALDQAFNPEGIHTYPSDAAIRADLQLARDAGLNMLRCHIKINEPRYYYWADKLGVLIMYDIPSPNVDTPEMRRNWEATFRAAVERDFNHPAVFAWVLFNETWGLDQHRHADSQDWLAAEYRKAKALDPTRLVEDNSVCLYDHTETDLNSWHYYINDYAQTRAHVEEVVRETFPGSTFNYVGGKYRQGTRPLLNSEYGGISAGHGDADTSWAVKYHTSELRRHDKICGYIFTELTDVEWEHNGIVNYDRRAKEWGYDAFVDGMSLRDVFGADVVGVDCPPCQTVRPGAALQLPLFVSNFGSRALAGASVRWQLSLLDRFGNRSTRDEGRIAVTPRHYGVTDCGALDLTLPTETGLGILALRLVASDGATVARNYVNFDLFDEANPVVPVERTANGYVLRFRPDDYAEMTWSAWPARPNPHKFARTGAGEVSYRVALPGALNLAEMRGLRVLFEASARAGQGKVDWKERARRTDYPQTEAGRAWPSELTVRLNGRTIAQVTLPDDPADARGVLSHHLGSDPGSHGYLQNLAVPEDILPAIRAEAARDGALTVSFAVDSGGFALYGARVGAYPVAPTLVVE